MPAFSIEKLIVRQATTETIDENRVTSNCMVDNAADIFSEICQYQLSTGNAETRFRICAFFLHGGERPLTTIAQSFTVSAIAEISVFDPWIFEVDYDIYTFPDPDSNQSIVIIASPMQFMSADYGWAFGWDNTYVRLGHGDLDFARPLWLEQSVLTLCNTELEVAVSSGRTTTTPISSQYGRFLLDDFWDKSNGVPKKFCFIPGENNQEGSLAAIENIHEQERQHLNSDISFCWNEPNNITGSGAFWWNTWFYVLDYLMRDKIDTAQYGISENGTFYGSYLQYETIFQIQWEWIILPVLLNILALVLQIVVIRQSRLSGQKHLWRGSVLATLYHGVEYRAIHSEMATIVDMRKDAGTNVVRLRLSKDGRAMLVPQHLQPPV
ncbi:hypothetical protein EKO27_g12010 [Xylaria grammica]|uniref:Uncharacterized protein n=1 Tax=Xylaria grammica TaxID=363999 RepID=A0A439CLQ8_9PEZI|nr:hypothetical protein EKO27_g12010 [Xylaria grammica]